MSYFLSDTLAVSVSICILQAFAFLLFWYAWENKVEKGSWLCINEYIRFPTANVKGGSNQIHKRILDYLPSICYLCKYISDTYVMKVFCEGSEMICMRLMENARISFVVSSVSAINCSYVLRYLLLSFCANGILCKSCQFSDKCSSSVLFKIKNIFSKSYWFRSLNLYFLYFPWHQNFRLRFIDVCKNLCWEQMYQKQSKTIELYRVDVEWKIKEWVSENLTLATYFFLSLGSCFTQLITDV